MYKLQCDQKFFSEPAHRGLNFAQIARPTQKFGLFCEKIALFLFQLPALLVYHPGALHPTKIVTYPKVLKSAQVGEILPYLVTLISSVKTKVVDAPFNDWLVQFVSNQSESLKGAVRLFQNLQNQKFVKTQISQK